MSADEGHTEGFATKIRKSPVLKKIAHVVEHRTHPMFLYGAWTWAVFVPVWLLRVVFEMGTNLMLLTMFCAQAALWRYAIGNRMFTLTVTALITLSFASIDSFIWGSLPARAPDQFIGLAFGLCLQVVAWWRVHQFKQDQAQLRARDKTLH